MLNEMKEMRKITIVFIVVIIFYDVVDLKIYKCWWEGVGTEGVIEVVRKGNKCYYKTEIGLI